MFQYAFGRRLNTELGEIVSFDVKSGFLNDIYKRNYALDGFKTNVVGADSSDIPKGMKLASPWHRVAKAAWLNAPDSLQRVFYEREDFQFDTKATQRRKRSTYYFGYWQHHSYVDSIETLLRHEFSLAKPPSVAYSVLEKEISRSRAVSIHVRRYRDKDKDGNVILNAADAHGTCDPEFYLEGLRRIGIKSGTVAFIFSDDPAWVYANLQFPVPCRYIFEHGRFSDHEEMMLMTACRHHVISNSSFSWWGAWLGKNAGRKVVAPKIWMKGATEDSIDFCPRGWQRI